MRDAAWIREQMERMGAVVLLILLAPLMVVLAIVIWLCREPALVTRRMTTADGRIVEVFVYQTRHSGAKTTIGEIMDRYSLKDLPMLINVVRVQIGLREIR